MARANYQSLSEEEIAIMRQMLQAELQAGALGIGVPVVTILVLRMEKSLKSINMLLRSKFLFFPTPADLACQAFRKRSPMRPLPGPRYTLFMPIVFHSVK
jgi:hypothetical protein